MVYPPKKAADVLGVSTATILRRIKDRTLPACKISRTTIRIDEVDNKAYKEKCMTGNHQSPA